MIGRGGAGLIILNGEYYIIGNKIITGGGGRAGELNDIWKISNDNQQQIKLDGSFSPRIGHVCLLVDDKVYVQGGQQFSNSQQLSEIFQIDFKHNELKQIAIDNEKIFKRNSHSLVFDHINQQFIIYGGANETGPLNDIYIISKGFLLNKDFQAFQNLQIKEQDEELKPREMHTAHFYHSNTQFLIKLDYLHLLKVIHKQMQIIQIKK